HTRSKRDWSSDVCSSDLLPGDLPSDLLLGLPSDLLLGPVHWSAPSGRCSTCRALPGGPGVGEARWSIMVDPPGCVCHQVTDISRSEERRVGKESESQRLA